MGVGSYVENENEMGMGKKRDLEAGNGDGNGVGIGVDGARRKPVGNVAEGAPFQHQV